jgi:hypothetical protein
LELWGSAFGDLVFGTAYKLLVSDRFKTLFAESGLRGLEGFGPVEITRVIRRSKKAPKGTPPGYYCVSAVRSRAVIDQPASGFEWREPPTCRECYKGHDIKRWKRIIFEPGTWSGEDVFEARGLSGYFTSERFKEFCDEHDIKNAALIPAEEYGHDFYPGENWSRITKYLRRQR